MKDFQKHFELIKTYLPKYLSPKQQENLFKDITEQFPYSTDPDRIYIRLKDIDAFYQGDGVLEIPFAELNLNTKQFNIKYFSASVLSNTCDIDPGNKRLDSPYVLVAAIIPLRSYLNALRKNKISKSKTDSFVANLKVNKISNLFYLPELRYADKIIMEESFVRLDYTTSLPNYLICGPKYNKDYAPDGDRIFTLSNYGFYIFLFKLSVHFSRFRENVFRG